MAVANKKLLIIITIILAIIVILFFIYIFISNEEVSGPAEETAKEETAKEETAKEEIEITAEEIAVNEEKISEIIKTGSLGACEDLQGDFKKVCEYNILMSQAVDNLDLAICDQIDDDNYRQGCLSLVNENKESGNAPKVTRAEEKKSYEEEMKEKVLNGSAYNNLMQGYNSGEVTERLYGEYIKAVAYVKQPNLCWELPRELRQECIERAYIILAKRQDNTEVCEKIATPVWEAGCYRQVLTKRALEQGDIGICVEIQEKSGQEKCRNSF